MTCRILTSDREREAARALVRRKYLAEGYAATDDSIARYLLLPSATTFGLFHDDTLYGTISLVLDNQDGLPMDALYAPELAPWRAEGKRLAEVIQFAVERTGSPFEAAPLFAAILARAVEEQLDYLCISVNPKHDRFYALLGFKQIGEMKHYASVDAPAIARALHVPTQKEHPLLAGFLKKDTE